jgi:hypothetical protein
MPILRGIMVNCFFLSENILEVLTYKFCTLVSLIIHLFIQISEEFHIFNISFINLNLCNVGRIKSLYKVIKLCIHRSGYPIKTYKKVNFSCL